MTSTYPTLHADFIARVRDAVAGDKRFHALLAGGSYIHGGLDEHSDLDLVLVVEEDVHAAVMASRMAFAGGLGRLLNAFTGEHVGEPRLLICLYGPPLLHVDLKFVTASDLDRRIERPAILFSRDPDGTQARLARAQIAWPDMTPDWFEARTWIWLHYGVTKYARGELYEAIGMLGYFREQILGPMLSRRASLPQRGVRRMEALLLDQDRRLAATVPLHERSAVRAAIISATELYLELRMDLPPEEMTADMPSSLYALLELAD